MPDTPEIAAEWRGRYGSKVEDHERRLDGIDADIREIRVNATAATLGLARLETSVEGLRGDISKALSEQAQSRRDEFTELQKAVVNNRMTSKEKMAQVVIPLIVVFISAMVILLSSKVI